MRIRRRHLLQTGLALASLGSAAPPVPAGQGSERVTFATNWYAQAEHGGFYQAVATGLYQQVGLDVQIKMGGAGVNVLQLLAGRAVDFAMGTSTDGLAALTSGIPVVTVAAIFQKDPQCLLAHPGVGNDRLEDLKGKPILASPGANLTYWPFLRSQFGFGDEQKRPYNFSLGPFLLDPQSAQQGYVTSEPYRVEKAGGFKPVVFLLADYGYSPYATTIETTQTLIQTRPDLVQRFVSASLQGWESYLQNPDPANQLIKQANPQMTDGLLAYSVSKMKQYGILTSGDAQKGGIGIMTDARWQEQFKMLVASKVLDPKLDYRKAFTLQFVGQKG